MLILGREERGSGRWCEVELAGGQGGWYRLRTETFNWIYFGRCHSDLVDDIAPRKRTGHRSTGVGRQGLKLRLPVLSPSG